MSVMQSPVDPSRTDVEEPLVKHLTEWQKRYDSVARDEKSDVMEALKADQQLKALADLVHAEVTSLRFLPEHQLLQGKNDALASLDRLMAIQPTGSPDGTHGGRFMVSPATSRIAERHNDSPVIPNTADVAWMNPKGSDKGW